MTDAFNDKRRNAQALAARQRKAGPHSGRRRPDVFDRINEYEEEQAVQFPTPFVGERVRIVDGSVYHMEEARVVSRVKGKLGVIMEHDPTEKLHYFWPRHLERFDG